MYVSLLNGMFLNRYHHTSIFDTVQLKKYAKQVHKTGYKCIIMHKICKKLQKRLYEQEK